MDPRLWQHQTADPSPILPPPSGPLRSLGSTILAGIVLVAFIAHARREFRNAARTGRRLRLTGWSDLPVFFGVLARAVILLPLSFLLIGRVLFWPRGRRW